MSSAVVTLDAMRLVAVTETGRVYELKGHPGGCLDADYVWNHWAAMYGVTSYISHSRQIWEQSDRGKMLMKRWAAAAAKEAK